MNKIIAAFSGLHIPGVLILCFVLLIISLRGIGGNPTMDQLRTKTYREDGPFELSPERGRFALTYSLVEDKSVFFSIPVARFATPDLGFWNGNYVSLFAPGVSLLVSPGYVIGKMLGNSQVGTFAVISLFAILNVFLIIRLSLRIGASKPAGILAGLLFLFATPAYAYAVNLYQHHISTCIILLGIWLLLKQTVISWKSHFGIWFLCALSVLVDYPNFFFMAPIAIQAATSFIFSKKIRMHTAYYFKAGRLITLIGVIIPASIFLIFNTISYGSPTRLSGTVPYVAQLDEFGQPVKSREGQDVTLEDLKTAGTQSAVTFFNPRFAVNGLYIHLFSPDRGVVMYTPIMIVALFGLIAAYRRNTAGYQLMTSVILIIILLYSMWGDPWGGWAFGSRYLIPAFALLSIFLAYILTMWGKYLFFLIAVFTISLYSIWVNTLGAITTSAIPPQVQVLELEKISGVEQKYTYMRNYDYILGNRSKSYVYNTFLSHTFSAYHFFMLLFTSIALLATVSFVSVYRSNRKMP